MDWRTEKGDKGQIRPEQKPVGTNTEVREPKNKQVIFQDDSEEDLTEHRKSCEKVHGELSRDKYKVDKECPLQDALKEERAGEKVHRGEWDQLG